MKPFIIALAAIALVVSPLRAQRFTVDLRGVVAAPTKKLADTRLNNGFGAGAVFAYRLQPHLHVYGGWDWLHFSPANSFAGSNVDFDETGYTAGLRFEHPFTQGARISYRLEGGGTYKHMEIENAAGDLVANSGHGPGYSAGTGLLLALPANLNLSTVVRYRSRSNKFTIGNATNRGELAYVGLEVGLSKRF